MVINIENLSFEIFPNNTINVVDKTDYSDCINFQIVEGFVRVFHDGSEEVKDSNSIDASESQGYKTKHLDDGRYKFIKLVVPHYSTGGVKDSGNIVWYDGELYQIAEDGKLGSKPIDLLQAYKAIVHEIEDRNEDNESLYFTMKELFLIGDMKKCLTDLQKEYILNKMSNMCYEDVKSRRDFMLCAFEVLKYLVYTSNFDEANRILDNLSSCGFLCEDKNNGLTRCNCG